MAVTLTDDELALVESCRVGHLATVDEQQQPHVVPVCYAWCNGVLYTPIDEKPKRSADRTLQRMRNIERNPRVCLTVDLYSEDWSELAWVQIRATASVLESGSAHPAAIAILRIRYPQYRAMALETHPLIQLTPTSIRSWRAA